MDTMKQYNFIMPSLKISGGVKEVFNLANELIDKEAQVSHYVMWLSASEVNKESKDIYYLSKFKTDVRLSLLQIPYILLKFLLIDKRKLVNQIWIFTHYSTFPLALVVPPNRRLFFVQGLEWQFIRNKLFQVLLKYFILSFYREGRVLTANRYITNSMDQAGIHVSAELPIWANKEFLVINSSTRNIDFAMVLRKGSVKRLDLYLEFILQANRMHQDWSFSVITPDDEIAHEMRSLVTECHLNPSIAQMSEVYSRSKIFLMLSDHEGFGLPPLEAMGAGCVPICRDAGGIRNYMTDQLSELVVPPDMDIVSLLKFSNKILRSEKLESYSAFSKIVFKNGLLRSNNRATVLMELDI